MIVFVAGVPHRPLTPEEAALRRGRHAGRMALQELALAIEQYHVDHGQWPGLPPTAGLDREPSTDWLERQLTMASNAAGAVAPVRESDFPFGPYLPGGLPVNPANGLADVRLVVPWSGHAVDGTTGWSYDAMTGEVWSNAWVGEREER